MDADKIVKRFGKRIQDERARQGLTLRDVAADADTSHQSVAAFEAGTGNHLRNLIKIAGRLGLSLELRENETGVE